MDAVHPTAWQRCETLFREALQRPASGRAEYLDEACGDDPDLRTELLRLLDAHARAEAGGELEPPGAGLVFAPAPAATEPTPGARIGPYEVCRLLGEGGFATVYLARQHEPVRREVALEILRADLARGEILARFEAERQVLALLSHSNVAKVFDAGTTPQGRPFFAMEHVPGVPLSCYCDRNRLTIRQRLELFLPVCAAVQHAHQRGIIHRDLKPSNVLVIEEDGRAVPKVIDFGIAKALSQPLTEHTMVTAQGRIMGTLAYMAPEQAGTTGVDVDTRTDVYALGVMLYELLTGLLPFDPGVVETGGPLEMVRLITEVDPPRPASRCGQLPADQVLRLAHDRATGADTLQRQLRNELEWIPLRALEKDRARRYDSASDLAADIRNYLDHRPLEARRPSRAYVLRKLVRRHRVAVAATAAVAITLVLGLLGTGLGLAAALRSQVATREEAAVARESLEFLVDAVESASPTARGPAFTVTQLLDEGAPLIDERFTDQPLVRMQLHEVYGRVRRALNAYALAEGHTREALELARSELEPHDLRVSMLQCQLGTVLLDQGRDGEAAACFRLARQGMADAAAPPLLEVAEVEKAIGVTLHNMGDYDRAEFQYRRARLLCGAHDEDTLEEAICLDLLARLLIDRGELEAARPLVDQALAIKRRKTGPSSVAVAFSLLTQGYLEQAFGNFAAATGHYRGARDMYAALHDGEAAFMVELARMDLAGVLEDAAAVRGRAVGTSAETSWQASRLGEARHIQAVSLRNRGRLLHRLGHAMLADERLDRAISVDQGVGGASRLESEAHTRLIWAELLAQHGDHDQAMAQYELALRKGHQASANAQAAISYGCYLLQREQPTRAEAILKDALSRRRGAMAAGAWPIAMAELAYGRCLTALGRAEGAERHLRRAHEILSGSLGPDDDRVRAAEAARAALSADGLPERSPPPSIPPTGETG